MTLHQLLDTAYGTGAGDRLRALLDDGADPEARHGPHSETALHVAVRRHRTEAVGLLLEAGADVDARTAGGKTAYAHAVRRGFADLAALLRERGASTGLNAADRFAVAVVTGRLEEARERLSEQPGLARTGNPEEDRLLADVAGRNPPEPVELLIAAGADLTATGLDTGTPLHQAAWFGQPRNARLLLDAGALLDVFEPTHQSSPLGWAVHGARYSGEAEERQDLYVELVTMLLKAGSSLCYPGKDGDDSYLRRLLEDATPRVRQVLEAGG
ncbi:MAG TPA: ankyrin repeat domain-containing protein [bacterium]|nr:ankyrin repeat domain-containing protein [bacterium]